MNIESAPPDDPQAMRLRLSAQRALLGNIPANLRCVSLEYRGTEIACRFVFHAVPSEEEKELLSGAATEIISDYSGPFTISEEYLAVPCPQALPFLRHLVYLRNEA
jgi:hypothetical protein